MENVFCCLTSNELEILDEEGIKYTIVNATQVDYYDVYDVYIEGEIERALDVLYKAAIY